jgi:hypothetical protein
MKVLNARLTRTDAEPVLRDRLSAEVVNHLALACQTAADWHGE